MLHKPINPEPYNTYITKDEHEIIGCDIPGNKKIIGDYTKIVDIETSETVYEAYSQYDDSPKSRIEYENVLANTECGKEYSWNTFYWEFPEGCGSEYTIINAVDSGDNLIHLDESIKKKEFILTEMYVGSLNYGYSCGGLNRSVTLDQAFNDDSLVGKCALYFFDSPLYGYDSKGEISSLYETDIVNCSLIAIKGKLNEDERYQADLDESGNYQMISSTTVLDANMSYYRGRCTYIYFDDLEFYNTVIEYCENYCDDEHGVIYCLCRNNDSFQLDSRSLFYTTENNNNRYYCLSNATFKNGNIVCEIYPQAQNDIPAGTKINIFSPFNHWNISPDYYFRCKTHPTITINTFPKIADENKLYDIQGDFSVSFSPGENCADINYYQLYLYAESFDGKYIFVEKSNRLFSSNDSHLFRGFISGNSYKVVAICIDNDGDEWTEEVTFTTQYNKDDYVSCVEFNDEDYAIKIHTNQIDLTSYTTSGVENLNCKIYKHRTGYLCADYVGDFLETDSVMTDYNIQNDMDYTYYVRISYQSSGENCVTIKQIGNVTPDFLGSCIMGLEKSIDGIYQITKTFYLNYHFNDLIHESNQELSRDYVGTFGKYQQELRGSSNYITGTAEGILGYEATGGYTEAKYMKQEWLNFINDDSIKLYKGFDGNTMLISITASKVKPRYYAEYGLINEVSISFKQVGDIENSTIYETEV